MDNANIDAQCGGEHEALVGGGEREQRLPGAQDGKGVGIEGDNGCLGAGCRGKPQADQQRLVAKVQPVKIAQCDVGGASQIGLA